jgi:hypothetical protein
MLSIIRVPAETRAAIAAALRADQNARRVLREVGGASYCTIRKIAKDAGIKLQRGGNHRHPKTQPA